MNEEKIEALKSALQNLVQLIMEDEEELDEDLELMLAQVMEHVANRIQQLRQEGGNAPPIPPVLPKEPLPPGPYPSSNVNAFKYDPKNKRLWVKFHGKDTADSGPTYMYQNIPEHLFEVFRRGGVAPITSGQNKYHRWYKGVTPSLGAAMYHLIKQGGYAYQRVS